MQKLTVKALTEDRIDQAFVLIQNVIPTIHLDSWRSFAGAMISQGPARSTGILVAECENKFFSGLAAYRIQDDLIYGQVVHTSHLLAFDLLDRKLIVDLLVTALEALAKERGCGAVHTFLDSGGKQATRSIDWMTEVLTQRGHSCGGLAHCLSL